LRGKLQRKPQITGPSQNRIRIIVSNSGKGAEARFDWIKLIVSPDFNGWKPSFKKLARTTVQRSFEDSETASTEKS